jgi:predicted ester cyclase
MSIRENAFAFFDACETGKGWEVCKQWCDPNATFRAQADALADILRLEDYAEWQKNLLVPIPDGQYELLSFGVDEQRSTVVAAAVFHGTHTVDPGDNPPTGKSVAADYCYVMHFQDDKISHMTKVWNDGFSLRELGWA